MDYVEGATNTSGQILQTVPGEFIQPFWCQRDDTPLNPGIPLQVELA